MLNIDLWFSSAIILGIFDFSSKSEVDSHGAVFNNRPAKNPALLLKFGGTALDGK